MRFALVLALLASGCGDNTAAPPDAAELDLTQALQCCGSTYIEGVRACAADRVTDPNVCFDLPCPDGPIRVCNVRGTTPAGCCLKDGSNATDAEVQACAAQVLPAGECGPLECGTGYETWRTIQVCGE